MYMKSETGWAPYVCEYCDYKTTVDIMFMDHINLHHIYSDSDDNDFILPRKASDNIQNLN